MSKKSYKKLQNQLYREIKRRTLAERLLCSKMEGRMLAAERFRNRKVETIKIEKILPDFFEGHEEFIKTDMVRSIANRLADDGYIQFYSTTTSFEDAAHIKTTTIEARLDVVKPEEGEEETADA